MRNVAPEPQKDSAFAEEASKLLAAMVNTGRANGKLEEVLAGMQPQLQLMS